jgi:uncharacterized protein YbaP (TraB family)
MSTRILRKILASFLLTCILFVAGVALCAEKAASLDKKNCLWRIKSKTNTVYVLGSIHLLKKENYPLNEAIEKAFDDSKKLVLEVNLASVNPEDVQKLVLTKGMLGDDKTLKESIGKETYELAKKKVAELGANIEHKNWVPKIESFLKEDANYLVVVGAAHLIGKEGVIELLKEKGYVAEQL